MIGEYKNTIYIHLLHVKGGVEIILHYYTLTKSHYTIDDSKKKHFGLENNFLFLKFN